MKSRYLIYIVLLSFVTLNFLSCDNFLDEMPDNRTELDSPEKIRKLLLSAYPNASVWFLAELSSDNVDEIEGNYNSWDSDSEKGFNWMNMQGISQDSPQWVWDAHYNAIASSNQVLKSIEEMGNEDGALNPHKGEALITRAYSHFVLANIFCKHYSELTSSTDLGLPYMEAPEVTVAPKYERGTVAELYEKINQDIEEGLLLIDDNLYDVPKYHFNKKAAYAFAARFNLYYRKYDKVIEYANFVLGNNPELQLRDWATQGAETNTQAASDLFVNVSEKANLKLSSVMSWWPYIHLTYGLEEKFVHSTSISDSETLSSAGPWGSNYNFRKISNGPVAACLKFIGYFYYSDPVAQTGQVYMVQSEFTTEETLLCRAEAYIMKGSNYYADAVKDINSFLSAFIANSATVTQSQIINFYKSTKYYTPEKPTVKKELNPDFAFADDDQLNLIHGILHLRRILTLHEGLRWYDIKRYGIEIERRVIKNKVISATGKKLSKDDPRRALQIPEAVISAGFEANPR